MIDAIVLLFILALTVLAFIRESRLLRVAAVAAMVVALVGREFSYAAYARSLVGNSGLEGAALDSFRDGVSAMVEYCEATSIYVYAVGVLLIILSVRGFRRPNAGGKS